MVLFREWRRKPWRMRFPGAQERGKSLIFYLLGKIFTPLRLMKLLPLPVYPQNTHDPEKPRSKPMEVVYILMCETPVSYSR